MDNDKSIDSAKELFIKYDGSYFHMQREGKLDFYKKFNITKEQELAWIKEHQKKLLKKIKKKDVVDTSFTRLTRIIRQYKDIECMNIILELINQKKATVDSFTKLRMAEEIIEIYKLFSNNDIMADDNLEEMRKTAFELLEDVLSQSITVADFYRDSDYMKEVTLKESIIDRAKRKLKKLKEL